MRGEFGAQLAIGLDGLVVADFGDLQAVGIFHSLPDEFEADLLVARLRELGRGGLNVGVDDGLALAQGQNALLVGILDEELLGLLELGLELLQPLLEELPGVARRLEAAVQIVGDEDLGVAIGHALCDGGVRVIEADVHDARVTHRLDAEPPHHPSGGGPGPAVR